MRLFNAHSYRSVIAVSGLNSHALGSWRSPEDSDVWLRDYLPRDVGGIRVLLYGYSSTLVDSISKDSIVDLGQRMLELICAFRQGHVCGNDISRSSIA